LLSFLGLLDRGLFIRGRYIRGPLIRGLLILGSSTSVPHEVTITCSSYF